MAAPDEEQTLAGGTLIANPSDVTTSPAYGGTILGTMQSVAVAEPWRTDGVPAEEYGGELVEETFLGREIVVTATLANFDRAALAVIRPGYSNGEVYPNANLAIGDRMSGRGLVLMFVPVDSTSRDGWKLYNAVYRPDGSGMLWSGAQTWVMVTTWVGYRDASDNFWKMDKLADL